MTNINIDFNECQGKIKIMHAVNNGPATKNSACFENFSELEIPYVRNHDASLSEPYGPQHVVDIHCIFPDFSKDENDERNYDFKLTDVYNETIRAAGSKVFYRLGSSIEHWEKKYGTIMPSDFDKWARICEHIIMHYNEGWANGYNLNIEYWEIWNEPDLDPDDSANKRTWGGTRAQFFDLYEIATKHLKGCFPKLKIGGPALAWNEEWANDFLCEMKKRNVELDFFSWHIYAKDTKSVVEKAERIRSLLIKHRYDNAESILNEWNYVRDWTNRKEYVQAIHGMKGAAYVAATMCAVQNAGNLDMLMYYDARQYTPWNGIFDFYTQETLKGYYPFKMFSKLYKLGNQTKCESDDNDIIATSATDDENCAAMITYYALDEAENKTVKIHTGLSLPMVCYLLDEEMNMEEINNVNNGDEITMKPNSVIFLAGKR